MLFISEIRSRLQPFRFCKYFHLLLILAMSLYISSCELFEGASNIEPNDPNIEYFGRVDRSNPISVRFDWPGVQIRTRFMGTSCSVRLKDGNNDYDVFIDGRLQKVLRTTSDTIYVLATNLENKAHSLLISKRTEAKFGMAVFEGFILDGGKSLVKPADFEKRRIEFIGDSFIAGFGSEGSSPDCKFSRETENCYIAFGPQLARR